MELKGKRLLFIGAQEMMCSAVETAKKMGVYTIVADYNKNFPAKRIADEKILISTSDTEALLKVCKEKKIDGVFSGYSETNQFYTLDLCEKGGYPYYGTRMQVETYAEKNNFKRCCEKYGVPTVPEYHLTSDLKAEDLEKLEYPIVIKPADSYSGKGITICSDGNMLPDAIETALKVSKNKRFLAEKYMDDEHYDIITAYYSVQNGIAALSAMVDRYMYEFGETRRLNTALLYPSQYLDRFISEADEKIRFMLKETGVKDGTLFIEGGVNADGFWFWESGFRLCGCQQNIFPSHINGVDIQEMLICHALTGKMADENKMSLEDPYFKGKTACNGIIFLNKGKISRIEGIEEIKAMRQVVNFSQLCEIGDEITADKIGTLNQSFSRFHIITENKSELFGIIEEIFKTLKVEDENGKNMIINTFRFDEMKKEMRWARRKHL